MAARWLYFASKEMGPCFGEFPPYVRAKPSVFTCYLYWDQKNTTFLNTESIQGKERDLLEPDNSILSVFLRQPRSSSPQNSQACRASVSKDVDRSPQMEKKMCQK